VGGKCGEKEPKLPQFSSRGLAIAPREKAGDSLKKTGGETPEESNIGRFFETKANTEESRLNIKKGRGLRDAS